MSLAEESIVVQGDLVRFGLPIYAELAKVVDDAAGVEDGDVAAALEDGVETPIALDNQNAALLTNPSATRTAFLAGIAGKVDKDGGGKALVAQLPDRVLTTGTTVVTGADVSVAARPVGKDELFINPDEDGNLASGSTNRSTTMQKSINRARRRRLQFVSPGSRIVDGLTIDSPMAIGSNLAHSTRFSYDSINSGVQLTPPAAGAIGPMLSVNAYGVVLDGGVQLAGAAQDIVGLYIKAFEARVRDWRLINFLGTALEVAWSANGKLQDLWIDNSGSLTKPAMSIHSPNDGSGHLTNTLDIDNLTIERFPNQAIHIGVGAVTNNESWAEFVRFKKLHMESSVDSGGQPNVDPLIEADNFRVLKFLEAWIYSGGPGGVFRHNQNLPGREYGNGGVVFNGGEFLGSDVTATVQDGLHAGEHPAATPYLFDLVNGDYFTLTGGATVDRFTTAAVIIRSTYGSHVNIDSSVYAMNGGNLVEDLRTFRTIIDLNGDLRVRGKIRTSTDGVPSRAGGSGTSGLAGKTDDNSTRGTITFGTSGTPPVADAVIVQLTFNQSFGARPRVTITPKNGATAALQLFAAAPSTGNTVSIYTHVAPAASQGSTIYEFDYHVIG